MESMLAARLHAFGEPMVVERIPRRDNALHEVHGLWAQWLALRGATAVLVRPDHLVYGSAMGTDSGLVLAQALERDLKAEHRDGAARAGATQVASSSG
jgi:hypothetical protein